MKINSSRYLIVDLESTCSNDGSVPRDEMEIIEVGALVQNARTFEVESEYQSFVHPVRHPVLTDFCRELTSITQTQVDSAPPFVDVLREFIDWQTEFEDCLFCSWGDYDRKQLSQDCKYHELQMPMRDRHHNIKKDFAKTLQLKKPVGVGQALKRLGMKFEGTPHRGIDDVRSMARIIRRVCTGT